MGSSGIYKTNSMKILVTGINGLMGQAIKSLMPDVIGLERKVCDITNYNEVKNAFNKYKPDVVLHLAAYTEVGTAEAERKKCYTVNVLGTQNIAKFSNHLLYLSTEYVFDGERGNYSENDYPNPVNFYGLTKLLGEYEAKKAKRFTIIRTLFKARPYKHQLVPTDMWTSGGYVDDIAPQLVYALQYIEKLPKILHIGFEKRNMFDFAKETRENILPIKRSSLSVRLPRDASLNSKLWKEFLNGNKT